jgi:flagellar biosynthetic protein FlhB
MADADSEKTEEPTGKRLGETRSKGNIPRSAELSGAALLLGGGMILSAMLPGIAGFLVEEMRAWLWRAGADVHRGEDLVASVTALGWRVLWQVSAVSGALALVSFATGAAQARGLFTFEPLAPKWDRLNPVAGLRKLLGVQSLVTLLKSVVKLVIIGAVAWGAADGVWADVVTLAQRGPMALVLLVREHAFTLLFRVGIAWAALAAADYGWEWWRWKKGLMMTKQEVKEEAKSAEGDPLIKQRLRSAARALARKRMLADVPKADVVVVNPIHIAVALRYDPSQWPAPFVVAIGQRKMAEKIKAIAYESGVPVIENKPIARALLAANVQPGTMIPVELYVAVAEILAFVMRQRDRFGSRWAGTALVDD